jgi:hypothetical protein
MSVSLQELSRAKDAAGALLDQLGLEAYLFEVEPRDGDWLVRIECAIDEGWQTTSLAVGRARLLTSRRTAGCGPLCCRSGGRGLPHASRQPPGGPPAAPGLSAPTRFS